LKRFTPAFFAILLPKKKTQVNTRSQPVSEKAVNFINRVKLSLPMKRGELKNREKAIPKSSPLSHVASEITQNKGAERTLEIEPKLTAPDPNPEVVEPESAQAVRVVQEPEVLNSVAGANVEVSSSIKTDDVIQKKEKIPNSRARKSSVRKKASNVKPGNP
jgi:hypothetical protein